MTDEKKKAPHRRTEQDYDIDLFDERQREAPDIVTLDEKGRLVDGLGRPIPDPRK